MMNRGENMRGDGAKISLQELDRQRGIGGKSKRRTVRVQEGKGERDGIKAKPRMRR